MSLADYVHESQKPDSLVVVREAEGRVVGVLWVQVEHDHLVVEQIARDQRATPGIGSELLLLAEFRLAPHFDKTELRLEALNEELVRWYVTRGFEANGPRYKHPSWGWLYPMVKRLS
jgi:hypothetical protein